MDEFVYFAIIGLCLGCGYALAALGISTLFNGSGVLNFAQGDFIMLAALFVAIRMSGGRGYAVAALEAIAVVMVVSVAVGLLFVRTALSRTRDIDLIIIGTVGVSIVLANVANNLLGTDSYTLTSPMANRKITFADYNISFDYLALVIASLALFFCFLVVYQKTDIGLQMRAMSADVEGARLSGVAVAKLTIVGWVLAGLTGAFAGILLGSVLLVNSTMGLALTISAFAAAMIGGLRNPWGALLGGIIIGLAETFAAGYLGTAARQAIAPVIIIVVLLAVPNGLLSGRSVEARVI